MTKQEFSTLAMAIRTFYPKENILPNQQAMALWYRELQDLPFPVAEAALRKWVSTQNWSPSIAELRKTAASVQHGEIASWGEGWEQVLSAVRKYGLYNSGQALASFDPLTREAVKQVGFREICISENIAVERANFRMAYEILADREKARQQVAMPLQKAINHLQSGGMLRLGEGEAE